MAVYVSTYMRIEYCQILISEHYAYKAFVKIAIYISHLYGFSALYSSISGIGMAYSCINCRHVVSYMHRTDQRDVTNKPFLNAARNRTNSPRELIFDSWHFFGRLLQAVFLLFASHMCVLDSLQPRRTMKGETNCRHMYIIV